jgi:hypothetical protein
MKHPAFVVLVALAALAGCSDVSIGPASITRGGAPIAQSAYAATFQAYYDHVPTIGWELRLGVDAPGTSCDAMVTPSTYTSIVIALANLGPKPPVLPLEMVALAPSPPTAFTPAMVAFYNDVDPAWTLDAGTITLTAATRDHVAGTISATAHRGNETAAVEGTFDAPLCPHLMDYVTIPGH